MNPGKFSGEKNEVVQDFIQKFNCAATVNGWNDELEIRYLPTALEGAALRWYENVKASTQGALNGILWLNH
jgi:hypothetical protein